MLNLMKRAELEQQLRYWQDQYVAVHRAYIELVDRMLGKELDAVGIIKAMQGPVVSSLDPSVPVNIYETMEETEVLTPPWEKEDPALVLTPYDWEQNGHG